MIKIETTVYILSVYILKGQAQKICYDRNMRQRGIQDVLSIAWTNHYGLNKPKLRSLTQLFIITSQESVGWVSPSGWFSILSDVAAFR